MVCSDSVFSGIFELGISKQRQYDLLSYRSLRSDDVVDAMREPIPGVAHAKRTSACLSGSTS